MKKLFVGNLARQTNEQGLSAAFEQYGNLISVKVITDKFSGESRGFGFVEIEDDQMADKAIAEMDNASVDGRSIRVNEARPQESRGGGFGGARSGGGSGGGRRGGGFNSDRRERGSFGDRNKRY